MKSFHGFLLILITVSHGIFESVQAQDQSGFISLDCGLVPKNTTYVEKTTKITYKSDMDYIESGVAGMINEAYKTQSQQQSWSLRSFPEGERNCYNFFNLTAKRKYLIRGSFFYGNYDGLNQLPSFDLHIGPNKWTSVSIVGVIKVSIHEIIHVLTQDRLQVCLVKTGETTPFISSLELRLLKDGAYETQNGSLIMVSRYNFSPTPSVVRYDEDIYDRSWDPYLDNQMVSISTNLLVNISDDYELPQPVAKTAAIPANASQPLTLNLTLDDITAQSYIYMYFAEIQNLGANETREFSVTYNGGLRWMSYFRPSKFDTDTMSNLAAAIRSPDGKFNFTFTKTRNSTLPPLINGLEFYKFLELPQLDTDQAEVSAMVNIKRTYELKKKISWQGDPCAPQIYRWEGLDCSYPDSEPPQIISLNLRDNKLTGTITPEISKLTKLIELDLSKNDLSGDIPAFFADMKSLKLIKLSGNPNLNSRIPNSLQIRLKSNSLTLVLSEREKVPVVAIALSVAGVFALLLIFAIFFFLRRKNRKIKRKGRTSNPSIKTKDLRITYPEVMEMTNNLERVLGKGGFGTVYHGNLDDTQVAVKVLSHSSAQGYKEYKAEVELLLRVHHRHLVRLVGYCNDGDNLALIYEYMAKGDLKENMSGNRDGNVLSWETRMKIAVDAAQGLEYLHKGCEPPMVHRDVKTTNILLNDKFVAKLADFGLSRSFPIDDEVSTAIAGTPGYLDPEYYRTNLLSETSDIYSFGVVLLEIITNQPVIAKERPHINEWVRIMLTTGDIRSIVDSRLMGDYDTNGAWKIVELALACVNPSLNRRPTMAHVVMELNECVALEIARKHGSQEMYSRASILSSASEFGPRAR